MKLIKKSIMALGALALGMSSATFAATAVDTLDASNPGPGTTYWVPDATQTLNSPYYRWYGQDWGWTHGAINTTGASSASLNVSAYDVDYPGEVDEIWALSIQDGWTQLGVLTGANNAYSYSTFALGASWFDEIALGLQVMMKIDTGTQGNWAVSLAKSVLEVDGGTLPNPNPGQVPVPAAVWLFGSGLLGLMGMRKKKA